MKEPLQGSQTERRPSKLRKFLDRNPRIHLLVVRVLRFLAARSPCVFCRIINGEITGRVIYQDDLVTAFGDAHPSASTHILIVSNIHRKSINDLQPQDAGLCGHLFTVAKQLALKEGLVERGYQLMINTGFNAGQTVFHLHMHLRDMESL